MFDDSKRLDALEGQMATVQKSIQTLTASIDALRKWAESENTKSADHEATRGKNQNSLIEDVEKGALATAAEMKKIVPRINYLEQQIKKLAK